MVPKPMRLLVTAVLTGLQQETFCVLNRNVSLLLQPNQPEECRTSEFQRAKQALL
jgi:hypothetical protein